MGYIRKDIVIDFHVPEVLKNLFIDAEKADERNDGSYECPSGYDELADTIDIACKNIYAAGRMTKEQWSRVVKKHPYPQV